MRKKRTLDVKKPGYLRTTDGRLRVENLSALCFAVTQYWTSVRVGDGERMPVYELTFNPKKDSSVYNEDVTREEAMLVVEKLELEQVVSNDDGHIWDFADRRFWHRFNRIEKRDNEDDV